eukprot:3230260-Pyramimonas_sp.AAC.1
MKGKAEFSGVYSRLFKHMADVRLVCTVKRSLINDGKITDDQLQKGLKPILADDGSANKLSPQCMFALVQRK